MMEIVTRAIFDCLDEEIILLNEDIQEDAIISSIKNLISEEGGVELREDTVGNYAMTPATRNNNISSHGHSNIESTEPIVKQNENHDDERSDLFATRGHRINQDVPNLIAFKPKKRRHSPYGDETQSQDITSITDLSSSYYFMNSMNSNHQMEEVATNKSHLKISRWMKRGKKGLLTIKKTRPSDRRTKTCTAEF